MTGQSDDRGGSAIRCETAPSLADAVARIDPYDIEAWGRLATVLDDTGQAADAVDVLKKGLSYNPSSAPLHDRLAGMLYKGGDAKGASFHLGKAVEFDPASANAWNNLAKISAQNNQLPEAERCFKRAVAAAPNQPYYLLELGKFLLLLGRQAEVERLLDQADELSQLFHRPSAPAAAFPQFVTLRLEIAKRMADRYLQSGRPTQALGHLEQAVLLGADSTVQTLFMQLLLQAEFSAPRWSLKPILERAFRDHWVNPVQLGRLVARLLLLETDYQELTVLSKDGIPIFNTVVAHRALTDPLLLSLLGHTVVADPAMEQLLTDVRRGMLRLFAESANSVAAAYLPFCAFFAALANQCFATEFSYAVSEEEAAEHASLLDRCRAAMSIGQSPQPFEIVTLACYDALGKIFDTAELLQYVWPSWIETVITRQMREPVTEGELKGEIPELTPVDDAGSLAVQQQYEENPFPRWFDPPVRTERQTLSAWVRRNFPNGPDIGGTPEGGRYETLVAGCGTGQEVAAFSLMLSDVAYLAIDLSLTSLAYALRRSGEMGLENVTFARGDLLQLRDLGRRFDVVISAGVLHHLDDPIDGWRTLRDVTKPGGVMLIALYSELARQDIARARVFAEAGDYGVSARGLRRFRSDILRLTPSPPWRDTLLARDDFYSLSMVRDLVFPARETTFDIEKIEAALAALDLRFRGFSVNADVRQAFQHRFGTEADMMSLPQWRVFEQENPGIFFNMYHLLAERM